MSKTNKSNKKAVAYEVVQVDNDKLKLIEGKYALSKEELDKLDNMIITVNGKYTVEKDPITGKISRISDGIKLSEMAEEKYKRLIEETQKREEENIRD